MISVINTPFYQRNTHRRQNLLPSGRGSAIRSNRSDFEVDNPKYRFDCFGRLLVTTIGWKSDNALQHPTGIAPIWIRNQIDRGTAKSRLTNAVDQKTGAKSGDLANATRPSAKRFLRWTNRQSLGRACQQPPKRLLQLDFSPCQEQSTKDVCVCDF